MIKTTMSRLVSGLILGTVALAGPAALAANKTSPGANINREEPWHEEHPVYQAVSPMKTTCKDFVASAAEHRNFVVAYLEGVARHKHHGVVMTDERFTPLSVPSVVQECESHPDYTVWAVIDASKAAM